MDTVRTTRCDDTCKKFHPDRYCPSRRWVRENRKLYRRRMLTGKKVYPSCRLRKQIAEETGCLRSENRIPRRVIPVF